MEKITLKQFLNLQGYAPYKKGHNLSEFADLVGLSIGYISKICNNRISTYSSKEWKKLCKYVESFGYELINPKDSFVNIPLERKLKALEEENKLLREELMTLKKELMALKDELMTLKYIRDYAKKICGKEV